MTEINETLKHCPRCNFDKPTEEFGKNKRNTDGLDGYCKPCRRSYVETHRASINASARAYYHNNREAVREAAKRYADANREAVRKRNRENYHKKKAT